MHITLFYCVQVLFFIYTLFFSYTKSQHVSYIVLCCFFSVSSSSSTCMMLCINVVLLVILFLFLCKFCIFNSACPSQMKQWHKALLIWVDTLFRFVVAAVQKELLQRERGRERAKKKKAMLTRWIYGDSVYIMNEYFQQLKCKKEGLCVYAVLKVNLFIANPWKRNHKNRFFASKLLSLFLSLIHSYSYSRDAQPQNLCNFSGS